MDTPLTSLPFARNQPLCLLADPLCVMIPRILATDEILGSLTKRSTLCWITQQAIARSGERIQISGRIKQTRAPVLNHLADLAASCCHHRNSAGHVFENLERREIKVVGQIGEWGKR